MNTRDTTFVCGDYNINLLSVNSDEHSSSFLNGTLSSGFLPAITLPTRASNNSTLIDNVFVNQQAEFKFSGTLRTKLVITKQWSSIPKSFFHILKLDTSQYIPTVKKLRTTLKMILFPKIYLID